MAEHAQHGMKPYIGGKCLSSPIMVASGTYGYGEEYRALTDYANLGALVCKTITALPREGNEPPRLKELSAGCLNSIGLANVGLAGFIENKLPLFASYECAVIVNVAGADAAEYARIVQRLEQEEGAAHIWGWELNVSCPNVSGGTNMGYDPKRVEAVVSHVRSKTSKPLLLKLPPSIENIVALGKAAEAGGANAITAINTLPGMWFDEGSHKAFFARGSAGLAGEAVLPLALYLVHALSAALSIPVVGVGGISKPEDALQFFMAGARAVQIGSANFKDPLLFQACHDAAARFFAKK